MYNQFVYTPYNEKDAKIFNKQCVINFSPSCKRRKVQRFLTYNV